MADLIKYKKLKKNSDLYIYQELEALKKEMRALVLEEIKKKLLTVLQQNNDQLRKELESKQPANIFKGITQIKGDKGEKGDIGIVGATGKSIVGSQGLRGLQGLTGAMGATGEQGLTGKAGKDGRDGVNGVDGKSAIFPIKEFKVFRKEIEELIKKEIKKIKTTKRFGGGMRGGGLDTRKVIYDEEVGTGDGTTTVYTLDFTPDTNISNVSISVGTGRLHITEDFTRSGKTLTFLKAPPEDVKIWADYIRE